MKILKAAIKKQHMYNKTPEGYHIFQQKLYRSGGSIVIYWVLKEKYLPTPNSLPKKLPFRIDGKIKSVPDKEKLKEQYKKY